MAFVDMATSEQGTTAVDALVTVFHALQSTHEPDDHIAFETEESKRCPERKHDQSAHYCNANTIAN